jgi:rhamnulokinase
MTLKSHREEFSCIAVDMGAGSIRVMLATVGEYGLSMEEIHRFSNEIRMQDGRDTWDMELIAREIFSGISMAIQASGELPESVGVDSWGADFVLLDGNGDLAETAVAYRDKRTEGMRESWSGLMTELETFSRTGINFYMFNTLFQMLSLKGSRSLQRSSNILFIPSYINYLLSGKRVNELTIASTSQMLGVKGGGWDSRILEKLELDKEKLGEVVQPGTKLGPVVLPEIGGGRIECVAVCGHDTACVVVAIPADKSNFAFISAGTWCIVGVESTRPLISEEALKLGVTNERGYGNSYRSLKNIVGLWLLQGLKKHLPSNISFPQLDEMVREDGETVQVIDPDDPCFYNPENMKQAFDKYFEKSGQPLPERFSDYIRCAYDSLCFSFRYYIEQLEKLSRKPIEVLHLVGGGSQSDYLSQRIASICQREVISGPVEGAAMGNVIVQGIAMGKIENLQAGRDLVKRSCQVKKYHPGGRLPGSEERYRKYLTLKT